MANEITLAVSLRWSKNGGSVGGSCTESYTQVGNAAFGNIQTVGDTTEAVVIGDVAGAKYLMFKNTTAKAASAAADTFIYIDKVTPVVPADAPIKLGGSVGNFQFTTEDTWYAIADTGDTVDLLVVAVEA
jgi:hypothetical protein